MTDDLHLPGPRLTLVQELHKADRMHWPAAGEHQIAAFETFERDLSAALQERLEAAEERLHRIASVAVVRGRCVFCSHPDDPADGTHTDTCPVAPESDPCPYVHDSGDRCVLQFEHGGSHDLGY